MNKLVFYFFKNAIIWNQYKNDKNKLEICDFVTDIIFPIVYIYELLI